MTVQARGNSQAMHRTRLEFRALLALETLRKTGMAEDDGVEFKRDLIEARGAARRIAAMANASRGAPFLWIIGVDERTGAAHHISRDLDPWLREVQSFFDGDSPTITSAHAEGLLVLGFEPDAPPYVVKTIHEEGVKGIPTHEVPWREGTGTRTARRRDLIKILVPISRTPEIEVLRGEVTVSRASSPTGWMLAADLRLYVVPLSEELVTLPAHRASVSITAEDGTSLIQDYRVHFSHEGGSPVEGANPSQLICRGPGMAGIKIGASTKGDVTPEGPITVRGVLPPVPDSPPATFSVQLPRVDTTGYDRFIWRLES
jgi:hypothetical protein